MVTFHCDNTAAVAVVNSGYSRVAGIMHLLRCLYFIRSRAQLDVWAVHTPGVDKGIADAISRDHFPHVFSQVPEARGHRVHIPGTLRALLVEQQPDWTLATWTRLFRLFIAPATRQNYKTGMKRNLEFCHTHQIRNPFPTVEQTLARFVAWLHAQQLASGTVKNYLVAVRHSQIALGLGDPKIGSMVQLEYVLRGMKRKALTARRERLPIYWRAYEEPGNTTQTPEMQPCCGQQPRCVSSGS